VVGLLPQESKRDRQPWKAQRERITVLAERRPLDAAEGRDEAAGQELGLLSQLCGVRAQRAGACAFGDGALPCLHSLRRHRLGETSPESAGAKRRVTIRSCAGTNRVIVRAARRTVAEVVADRMPRPS
jgi:hypothetical protein